LPEQGELRAAWGRGAEQQCLAHFNLSKAAVSANHPVRMLNVQCEESKMNIDRLNINNGGSPTLNRCA
jgi:outer membrane usher protein